MFQEFDINWLAAIGETDPQTCGKLIDESSTGGLMAKLVIIFLSLAYVVGMSNFAIAEVAPTQPPIDTTIGGTGASKQALSRLAPLPANTKTLQNLTGPNFGENRARDSIHMVSLNQSELPGVDGFYLRSSYVVLGPGGFAPIHSHVRRPAFLQVISGSVAQHRSDGISLLMGPSDFTFSSDQLAHWWINGSADTAMRLWIVEVCSAEHGCTEKIEGGALVVGAGDHQFTAPGKTSRPSEKTLMAIDLAGEFPGVSGLGKRELRLRKLVVAPGAIVARADLGQRPTYIRIAEGSLSISDSSTVTPLPTHSIVYAASAPEGPRWKNPGTEPAVLYVVDLVDP